jgi:hypothetical protein
VHGRAECREPGDALDGTTSDGLTIVSEFQTSIRSRGPTVRAILSMATLIFLICGGARAQSVGAWGWTHNVAGYAAGTLNGRGDGLVQFCTASQRACYWLLGVKAPCQVDAENLVLVNTDVGANALQIKCMGRSADKTDYSYAFEDFGAIDTAVSNATRIGFALAVKNARFIVAQFDLSGERVVVSAMRHAASAALRPAASRRDRQDARV